MAYAIAGTECKDVSCAQPDPVRSQKASHGPKSKSFSVFHRIVYLIHKQLGINHLLWLHETVASQERVQRELTCYIGPPVSVDAYLWGGIFRLRECRSPLRNDISGPEHVLARNVRNTEASDWEPKLDHHPNVPCRSYYGTLVNRDSRVESRGRHQPYEYTTLFSLRLRET